MTKAEIVPIGLAKPDENVIGEIRMLLKLAEEGRLRSLVWCGCGTDGWYSGFTNGADIFSTIGCIERMKHRLLLNADERTEHNVD